jgi:hypothetical protein
MSDLTIAELDALEKLAEKATPGPWTSQYDNDVGPNDEGFWEFFSISGIGAQIHGSDQKDNADYIAACDPQTILRLCAMARKGVGA